MTPEQILQTVYFLRIIATLGAGAGVVFFGLNRMKTWDGWARFSVMCHFGLFYLCTLSQPAWIFAFLPILRELSSPTGAPVWGAVVGVHFAWTLAGISAIKWYTAYTIHKEYHE